MTTTEMTKASTPVLEEKGGAAIVAALKGSGVEVVFGYPGGGLPVLVSPLLDVGVATIAAKTELTAAWMAYGYNRVKRRAAAACLFHSVGFLHTAPAIYAAKLDSTPLLVMGLNLASTLDLREPLQEGLDIQPALKPLAKYIRKLVVGDDLPLAVRQAVVAASTGRFGPSVLEFAFQVLGDTVTCPVEDLVLPDPPAAGEKAIARAWDMIAKAKRPVIVVGGGVHNSDAAPALREFAEALAIPVVSSSRGGRGLMPDDHPLYAGPLGSFGWTSANDTAQRADLWTTFGISFSQNSTAAWTLGKPADVIQVDIDPYEIGKIFEPTLGITADAQAVLRQLLAAARSAGAEVADFRDAEVTREVESLKAEWWSEYNARFDGTEVPINQMYVMDLLSRELPAGSLCIPDSGGHAGFLNRGYKHRDPLPPVVTTTRYQSMGAGLPMAIGAKLAAPERTVVSYHGDGGFYYDFQELATLSSQNIKVIVIVDNNGCVMFNRAGFQLRGMNPDLAGWTLLPDTDFVGIAKAMGVDGERVEQPGDLRGALQRAQEAPGSYLLDVVVDPETRMKRALPGVIPNLFDRSPEHNKELNSDRAAPHYDLRLVNAWPK